MKKTFLKKVSTTLLTLFIAALISTSCSSDEDPQVVFTSLTANKTDAFIEEVIVLNLEGTGFTDATLASADKTIKISKVSTTIYEISATTAIATNIYVTLSNNTYKVNKSIALNFYEHGVKNYKTVEGITVDIDKSAKIITLLGEPDTKTTTSDGLSEHWRYASKGINFLITKSNSIVNQADLFSSFYYYTNSANAQISYTNYPYEIGNTWKINSTTTMDMIIAKLGTPTAKSTSTSSVTNRAYQYTNPRIVFRFYSDSEDNYTGKKIIFVSIY